MILCSEGLKRNGGTLFYSCNGVKGLSKITTNLTAASSPVEI
jgi:hypothetical protein